ANERKPEARTHGGRGEQENLLLAGKRERAKARKGTDISIRKPGDQEAGKSPSWFPGFLIDHPDFALSLFRVSLQKEAYSLARLRCAVHGWRRRGGERWRW